MVKFSTQGQVIENSVWFMILVAVILSECMKRYLLQTLLADPSSSNVTIHCERNNCFEIVL